MKKNISLLVLLSDFLYSLLSPIGLYDALRYVYDISIYTIGQLY